jgi:hypothetical protein
MIKKKVEVKTKDHDQISVTEKEIIKPPRGRPKTKMPDVDTAMSRLPSSRVFTLSIENKTSSIGSGRTNNIIRLKLKISHINKLELYITENKGLLGYEQSSEVQPFSNDGGIMEWSDNSKKSANQPQQQESGSSVAGQPPNQESQQLASVASLSQKGQPGQSRPVQEHINEVSEGEVRGFTGLENFIKLRGSCLTVSDDKPIASNRKDLIINSGIKRTTQETLQVFADSWPLTSPYACWYCCHTFDATPVGIPAILTNYVFRCYGNFCSYNCAKRYLCPLKDDEDDMASMQSSNDLFKGDDQGEKLQLLELLYHLETGADMDEPIKTAPRRLILKMFGGTKTIEEFRRSFKTNTTYHTFKMPLASMAYHMEECVDTKATDVRRKLKNMSLDVARLEQSYQDLMRDKKRNAKLVIQKSIAVHGKDV